MSILALVCTVLRVNAALVRTTVGIQMFKVPCTHDRGAASPFRMGIGERNVSSYAGSRRPIVTSVAAASLTSSAASAACPCCAVTAWVSAVDLGASWRCYHGASCRLPTG